MGEHPQVPGEWDPSGSGEPPAQLLRRAISHVESLLHRMEPPPESGDGAGAAAVNEPAVTELEPAQPVPSEMAPPRLTVAPAPTPANAFVPMSSVSSAEKAEALRITLHAHEQAHRLQSEANALRAVAAADGEAMLLQARAMSEHVHVEARETATALLEAARRESYAVVEAARAEAAGIRQRAVADHDSRRAEHDAMAEQERAAALDEANVIIEQAHRDAERIRAEAREQGRAEAARLARQQVADAVADVRRTMHGLLDQVRESVDAFDASVRGIESDPVVAPQDPPASSAEPEQHDVVPPVPPVHEPRRPLGLLFGANRG